MRLGIALGIAFGIALDMEFGIALGIALSVALGIALGIASCIHRLEYYDISPFNFASLSVSACERRMMQLIHRGVPGKSSHASYILFLHSSTILCISDAVGLDDRVFTHSTTALKILICTDKE